MSQADVQEQERRRHLVAVFFSKAQDDVPPLRGGVGGVKHLEKNKIFFQTTRNEYEIMHIFYQDIKL